MAEALIATLGTKPQVVTTAVDLLLSDGHPVTKVVVLYTSGGRALAPAIDRLQAEFSGHPSYKRLLFEPRPIAGPDGYLADVATEADAQAAFRALYREVLTAKRAGDEVHLSIVGGRKVFAVYGMAAAQLLFEEDDRLWCVLVGGRFFLEERLHPNPGDEAKLVRVPVLRWGTISATQIDLSQVDDQFAAGECQSELRLKERLEEARGSVLGSLSGAERRVVELLVREGLTDEQIGERLSVSRCTVGTHLEHIYRKARDRWGLETVNRSQLVGMLSLYFTLRGGERENREDAR